MAITVLVPARPVYAEDPIEKMRREYLEKSIREFERKFEPDPDEDNYKHTIYGGMGLVFPVVYNENPNGSTINNIEWGLLKYTGPALLLGYEYHFTGKSIFSIDIGGRVSISNEFSSPGDTPNIYVDSYLKVGISLKRCELTGIGGFGFAGQQYQWLERRGEAYNNRWAVFGAVRWLKRKLFNANIVMGVELDVHALNIPATEIQLEKLQIDTGLFAIIGKQFK